MDLTPLFSQAIGFHQDGKLDEAGRVYGQILKHEPGNFAARQLLALVRFQQGENQDALEEIIAALAIKPDSPEALATRGNILIKLHRLDEALESFDRAIALKPDYAEALYNRGNCRQYLDRYEDAVTDYTSALALHSGYEPALTNRGNVLSKLGRFSEGLADYEKAEQLRPGDPLALYHRANALKDLQRFADALACYDAALARDPEFAMAWNNRGSALRELSRPEEALGRLRPRLDVGAPRRGGAVPPRHIAMDRIRALRGRFARPRESDGAGSRSSLCARQSAAFENVSGADWRDFEMQKKTLIDRKACGRAKRSSNLSSIRRSQEAPQDLEACAKTPCRALFGRPRRCGAEKPGPLPARK